MNVNYISKRVLSGALRALACSSRSLKLTTDDSTVAYLDQPVWEEWSFLHVLNAAESWWDKRHGLL